MSMKPKVAVLSGGRGGIGRAIVSRLEKDGYHVCALVCDVTKSEEVYAAVAKTHAQFGSIDVAIHAAVSPLVRERASVIDPLKFRQQFEVAAFGALVFFQAVLPYMRAQKSGHLIGITTKALDTDTFSGMSGYLCAKFALRGLLRELRFELAPNIRVDEVSPGFVPTTLHADLPEAVRAFITERAPSQTPEEVADAVSKLLRS